MNGIHETITKAMLCLVSDPTNIALLNVGASFENRITHGSRNHAQVVPDVARNTDRLKCGQTVGYAIEMDYVDDAGVRVGSEAGGGVTTT